MLNFEDVNDVMDKDSRCTLNYIQVRTCIFNVGFIMSFLEGVKVY